MEKTNTNELTVKEKLLSRGVYYIIEVKNHNSRKKKGELCLVLATSEKAALNKIKRSNCYKDSIECIGIYNKKENTLLLKNADKILDVSKLNLIED